MAKQKTKTEYQETASNNCEALLRVCKVITPEEMVKLTSSFASKKLKLIYKIDILSLHNSTLLLCYYIEFIAS